MCARSTSRNPTPKVESSGHRNRPDAELTPQRADAIQRDGADRAGIRGYASAIGERLTGETAG